MAVVQISDRERAWHSGTVAATKDRRGHSTEVNESLTHLKQTDCYSQQVTSPQLPFETRLELLLNKAGRLTCSRPPGR